MVTRKPAGREYLTVAAISFKQGDTDVYAFAISGKDIPRIAEISRIKRDKTGLVGFQRKEIQQHVKQITDYLNKGPGLFPNALILAVMPAVRFMQTRGRQTDPSGAPKPGHLEIPIYSDGRAAAWIVDGQQRSIALAKSGFPDLLVPVIAFVSGSLDVQRQQFILVNRAKPLSGQLVNELLPETDNVFLPKDLAFNKLPAQLCSALHSGSKSPFRGRVSRKSELLTRKDVFNDSAIIAMIRDRINLPAGALTHLKGFKPGEADMTSMYRILEAYWSAVADTFPDAWRLPPERSRLTHSAGLKAMGSLMDRIAARVNLDRKDLKRIFAKELQPLARVCCWTQGVWPYIDRDWHAIEQTTRSVNDLTRALTSLYMDTVRE